jgi:hypothetical protein
MLDSIAPDLSSAPAPATTPATAAVDPADHAISSIAHAEFPELPPLTPDQLELVERYTKYHEGMLQLRPTIFSSSNFLHFQSK